MDITHVSPIGGPIPLLELPERETGASHQTANRGSTLDFSSKLSNEVFSAKQQGFEIRVSPLLGELPKSSEPHLSAYQLYRWQLDLTMWSYIIHNI